MKLYWYVALGAAIGGVLRFGLTGFIQQRATTDFPTATLMINVTGSFVLGFVMRYALQSGAVSPEVRSLLTTGFCGGFTTFSTFSYETVLLLEDGEYGRASLYVIASVAVALAATLAGFAAAQQVIAWRERM